MNKEDLYSFLLFTAILTVSIYYLFNSDKSVHDIERHFINSQYGEVIKRSEILLRNSDLGKHQKCRLYILKAASEFMLNQNLNSQLTLIQLLEYDQTIALNDNEIAPQIVQLFNELKDKINRLE